MPDNLLQQFAARGAIVLNGMGMTETGPTVFLMDEANAMNKIGSVGKPQILASVRLVGPDGVRVDVSTAETTATGESVPAYGMSYLTGTSVASTPVYELDPPIPGVAKTIAFGSTDSALYVKTSGGEYIIGSSIGSSATVIRSSLGGVVQLVGLTTAKYGAVNVSSTAVNGVKFQATT